MDDQRDYTEEESNRQQSLIEDAQEVSDEVIQTFLKLAKRYGSIHGTWNGTVYQNGSTHVKLDISFRTVLNGVNFANEASTTYPYPTVDFLRSIQTVWNECTMRVSFHISGTEILRTDGTRLTPGDELTSLRETDMS